MTDPSDAELEQLRKKKLEELKRKMTTSQSTPKSTPSNKQGVIHLTNQNFEQTIQKGITLVDFWAEWCMPCRTMGPVIEQLAQEFAGRVQVGKLNVDENMELAMRFQVQGIPTFGIFKDGKLIQRIVGAVGYQPLNAALMKLL
ncbi:MAG: thioredoxin [Promethearchaeota archaeon]